MILNTTPTRQHPAPPTGPTILQVLPAMISGGVERGVVDLSQAIVQAGGRALVASSGGPMVQDLRRVGADHVTLPLATKNPFGIRANIDRLHDLIYREAVDLVHARSRAPAWSAYLACQRRATPFVTTVHAAYTTTSFPYKTAYNAVMTKGDRVIAVSEFVRDYVLATYPVETDRARLIHRGVNTDRFRSDAVSAERVVQLARRWLLPDGVPVILMPGRLSPTKGQEAVLMALSRLPHRDFRCLIVGSAHGKSRFRTRLERRIKELGLTGVVQLTEPCDDMPAAYKLSDLVIAASRMSEGFGRVVAEAQAMGRPVIASATGAPKEILIDGVTGWLVAPGDAAATADAIQAALALAPEARGALAETAVARIDS